LGDGVVADRTDEVLQLSRRRFLAGASRLALGIGAAGAGLLTSCGGGPEQPFSWADRSLAHVLDFANWPYYIDRTKKNDHPSLDLFTKQTGIDVNYSRPIRGNAEFLSRIRPALAAGKPTGFDLIVVTNGPQLSTLIREGWVLPIKQSRLKNFQQHASDLVRDPPWDPGNRHSVAWQSGLTGIAYRPEAVAALGRKPASVLDLWHKAFRGRVGMMSDLMDLGSVALLANGILPQTSTPSDWTGAAELLERQHDEHLVRAYYDQGYLRALQSGEVWISQAWSGDIFQARESGHHELEFVVPSEGGVLWTDNLLIPAHAEHPLDALMYMDFVYRPEVAAMITAWVGYITPVDGVQPIIRDRYRNHAMANSPLVFPQETSVAPGSGLTTYPAFRSHEEETAWLDTFGAILAL
jgi:spermidine/putrescine transport system substrate-binding protein